MGFPLIQVVMIAARQVSKPIAERVMRYGRDHPFFRRRVLVPVGRYIVHMKTRLRMERLGLGKPMTEQQITEAVALEEATEAVQQVIIFSYSVGVFAAYWAYTTYSSEETVKASRFAEYQAEHEQDMAELRERVSQLEATLGARGQNKASLAQKTSAPSESSTAGEERAWLRRATSLPVDAVTRLLFGGCEFVVSRRDSTICIELAEVADARGPPLIRKKQLAPHDCHKGCARWYFRGAALLTGWQDWQY